MVPLGFRYEYAEVLGACLHMASGVNIVRLYSDG
jgi:hypothetical protein